MENGNGLVKLTSVLNSPCQSLGSTTIYRVVKRFHEILLEAVSVLVFFFFKNLVSMLYCIVEAVKYCCQNEFFLLSFFPSPFNSLLDLFFIFLFFLFLSFPLPFSFPSFLYFPFYSTFKFVLYPLLLSMSHFSSFLIVFL